MSVEIISVIVAILAVVGAMVLGLVNYFSKTFRSIGKESRDDYKSLLKELSDIRIDIANVKVDIANIKVDITKLQSTTDNIKSEIAIIRSEQTEIKKEVDTIRKDSDRAYQLYQFNLFESRHLHGALPPGHAKPDEDKEK